MQPYQIQIQVYETILWRQYFIVKITSQLLKTFSSINSKSTQNQNSILSFNDKAKCEAEIVWSLFSVRYYFSDNSRTNCVFRLSRMFYGVDNVQNLALSKNSINVM